MNTTPPPLPSAVDRDTEQLRLLATLHFVFGGLAIAGLPCLALHFFVMNTVFTSPGMWKGPNDQGTPPPPEVLAIFKVFYVVIGLMLITAAALNITSGFALRAGRRRTFSQVVAVLDCLQMPFGTLLGVFTLIALNRDSVIARYAANERDRA